MTAADESSNADRKDELALEPEPIKDLDVEDVAAEQVLGGGTRTTKAQPGEF